MLLRAAFWLDHRGGRLREQLMVSRTDVVIRSLLPSGRVVEHRFNPLAGFSDPAIRASVFDRFLF